MVTVSDGTTTMRETVTLNVTDYDLRSDATVNSDEAVWTAADAAAGNAITPAALTATSGTVNVQTGGNAANQVADVAALFTTDGTFEGVHASAGNNGFSVFSFGGVANTVKGRP